MQNPTSGIDDQAPKRPRDLNRWAKRMVDIATGSADEPESLPATTPSERASQHRVQITTDGHKAYLDAVSRSFGGEVDYAMLVNLNGEEPGAGPERKYSPGECIGARKERIEGDPDMRHVSTSYAERNNLNVRMHQRRMTRLTNGFSKKVENHAHAMALHFLYYNFVRVHQSLRMSPAMAAGVTKRLWEMKDVVDMLETWEAIQARQRD